jgi:hypothetical protein
MIECTTSSLPQRYQGKAPKSLLLRINVLVQEVEGLNDFVRDRMGIWILLNEIDQVLAEGRLA